MFFLNFEELYKYNFFLKLRLLEGCCINFGFYFVFLKVQVEKIGLKSLSELGLDRSRVLGCLRVGIKDLVFLF